MEHTTAFSLAARGRGTGRAGDARRVRRADRTGHASAASRTLRRSLIGFVIFLVVWGAAALFFPAYVLPSPVTVLRRLPTHVNAAFLTHLAITLQRVGIGFLAAFVLGTTLGIAGYLLDVTQQLNTLMLAQQVLPGTILGVIFLLIFGVGGGTPIALVTVLTLPLIATSTANALAKVDQQLAEVMTSMGGGTLDMVRHLYLPTLAPTIQSNLTLGFGLALKIAILGEFVGAQDGLGYRLNVARVYFRMDQVFFYLFTVLLITLIFQIVQSLIFEIGLRQYI